MTIDTTKFTEDYTSRELVQNGIDWLDEYAPADWRDRINPDEIVMMDATACIAGQVFSTEHERGYDVAYEMLQEQGYESLHVISLLAFVPCRGKDNEPIRETWVAALAEHRELVSA